MELTQTITSAYAGAELTRSQFDWISGVVKNLCGINLHDGKMALVRARLSKRIRTLGFRNFGQYVDYIRDADNSGEINNMLDALSTNLTHFFREAHHFDFLTRSVVPRMISRHLQDRRLRLWSAGCSSGEEPYSIAMTLMEGMPNLQGWDPDILATDLSHRVLHDAQRGVYEPARLRSAPASIVQKYFTRQSGPSEDFRIKDSVRRFVHFARLNLMEPWPMKGKFDVIFCRNVMIYFDKPTQAHLISRLWEQLAPGGTLFIGHSESLAGVPHRFRFVQSTVYEKPDRMEW